MWRLTRYSIVFWGYPPHEIEEVLPHIIRAVDQHSEQPLTWTLANQPGRPIPTTREEWLTLGAEYREENEFGALFVTLDSTVGLSISLGMDEPLFMRDFDVLSVGLDTKHVEGPQALFSFEEIYALFIEGLGVFQPFWGEVCDHELTRTDRIDALRFSVDRTQVPDTIHWFNFFDEGMTERLGGKKRLLSAPVHDVEEWESPPGIVLILQREPFDFHNPEHRQRQEGVVQYLELERLHDLYPKKRNIQLADRSS